MTCTAAPVADHLVPVPPGFETGSSAAYRKLYEQKLFITPGDVARCVHLPSHAELEGAVSVYQRGAGKYWVTLTEPSRRIYDCIPSGDEKFTGRQIADPRSIRTKRWDAALPQSTGLMIGKVWLAMLKRAAPEPCRECIQGDSTREIFSAIDSDRILLRASLPIEATKHRRAFDLLKLAYALADYARSPNYRHQDLAADIEKRAMKLLVRVSDDG